MSPTHIIGLLSLCLPFACLLPAYLPVGWVQYHRHLMTWFLDPVWWLFFLCRLLLLLFVGLLSSGCCDAVFPLYPHGNWLSIYWWPGHRCAGDMIGLTAKGDSFTLFYFEIFAPFKSTPMLNSITTERESKRKVRKEEWKRKSQGREVKKEDSEMREW